MNKLISLLKKVNSKYFKYDIGRNYDPPSSFADILMRFFYARLYQKESSDLRKQICKQYRYVSILFHLRRAIRKLKLGKIPIRIVFLGEDPLHWKSMDSLYHACLSDSRFKTHVVNMGYTWQSFKECSSFFAKNHIEFIEDEINNRIQLNLLNPDIFVVSIPYEGCRPNGYETGVLLRYANLVYIPYSIDYATGEKGMNQCLFNLVTIKNAWRIFARSEKMDDVYRKYGRVKSGRVVSLGTPRIDQYYTSSSSDVLPEEVQAASKGKFKIIYSPHWSIDGWSTFLRNANHIRRLVQENKDCYLVFRPHPGLKSTLKNNKLMSEDEFLNFFDSNRCYLYEGDNYYGLFHWSDMLISDFSSFLAEYAPTRNPIMYLHREDGWGLGDTIREDIFNSCYVARSEDEITTIFQQIKNGLDPLKGKRERYQENICMGMFTGGAGKRIAAYLSDRLA